MSYIEVLHPGIGCSIQDKGRFGHMSDGVPISGAMDQNLAGLANLLLGNPENLATIEWKLMPPKLVFFTATKLVVVGQGIQLFLNSKSIDVFKVVSVQKNDTLHVKLNTTGSYGYIAVLGGFQTEKVLGSYSFYPNITSNGFLIKGMQLPIFKNNVEVINSAYSKISPLVFGNEIIELEAYKAPEFDLLTTVQKEKVKNQLFSVGGQSNRMGYLLNELFDKHSKSILSSPVLPGTVQWTSSGKLIILMRDAQTVGGYPRILQLKEESISALARTKPNGFIKFKVD